MSDFQENPFGGQENIFTSATQGKFFRPMDTEYKDTPSAVKIIWLVIAVLALLGTVVFFILRACSFGIMLSSADLDKHTIEYVVKQDVNMYGKVFTVFQTETASDGRPVLVVAERDTLGFWHVQNKDEAQTSDGTAIVTWTKDTTGRYFSLPEGLKMEVEDHYVYAGRDAINKIEIKEDQLPDNAAVSITQKENEYRIHMIRFYVLEEGENFSFSFEEILRENGCIE